jgi:hypothetical protein
MLPDLTLARLLPARLLPARLLPARLLPARLLPARLLPARLLPARLLPAQGMPAVPVIGGYWPRSNDVEIDIVGADREPVAKQSLFLGSVEWGGNGGARCQRVWRVEGAVECGVEGGPLSPASRLCHPLRCWYRHKSHVYSPVRVTRQANG